MRVHTLVISVCLPTVCLPNLIDVNIVALRNAVQLFYRKERALQQGLMFLCLPTDLECREEHLSDMRRTVQWECPSPQCRDCKGDSDAGRCTEKRSVKMDCCALKNRDDLAKIIVVLAGGAMPKGQPSSFPKLWSAASEAAAVKYVTARSCSAQAIMSLHQSRTETLCPRPYHLLREPFQIQAIREKLRHDSCPTWSLVIYFGVWELVLLMHRMIREAYQRLSPAYQWGYYSCGHLVESGGDHQPGKGVHTCKALVIRLSNYPAQCQAGCVSKKKGIESWKAPTWVA